MLNKIKQNRLLFTAITCGIIGLALLGFYNTATALAKTGESQNTSNDAVTAAAATAADIQQSSISGCPGNCALCGLCSSSANVQSEVQIN